MTDREYKIYDEVVASIWKELADRTHDGMLVLGNFNPESKEYKCILGIANMICNLSGLKLKLNMPWFKFIIWKLKNKKIAKNITKNKDCGYVVNIAEVINQVYMNNEHLHNGYTLSQIYDEYYAW